MRERLLVLLLLLGTLGIALPGAMAQEEVQATPVLDPQPLPLALSDGFEFLKTKTLLITGDDSPDTNEQMIPFERDRIMYGAISELDRQQRYGNYFTFFWKTDNPANVVVRLEFRQSEYGDYIQAVEVPYPNADGKEMTKFAVIGDDYREGGAITSWRCMIIENDTIVALTTSRLWK